MKMKWKKIMVGVLVVMLVLQPMGLFNVGKIWTVEAATDSKSGLTIVNEREVSARVLELAQKLGINITSLSQNGNGIYFTTTKGYCATGSHSGCTKCSNVEVIKKQWFKDIFGEINNVNLFPSHYSAYKNNSSIGYSGQACAGFAAFSLWYIAKEDNDSSVYKKMVGDTQIQDFTIANLKSSDIRVGDIIRINVSGTDSKPHSMMFISMNESAGTIKVLDCNWKLSTDNTSSRVRIHDITMSSHTGYSMAITRASNYEPDYGITYTLPSSLTSTSSSTAKANIISYATSLEGWNRSKFINAGRNDIPSGDWCSWFLKLCGERVGVGNLFSTKTTVSSFCTDMINNYNAKGYYYSDSSFLTSSDKTVLNGASAVTKSSFTPQPGDIYILHESGFSGLSQVGFVTKVVDGSIYAVVGNNGTAEEVQIRASTSNYFYKISNANCPIIGYIRPNYASLDKVALSSISLSSTSVSLNVGATKTLAVTYNPSNTTDSKTVTWKSSNASVATVSNGKVTAVAPGTATITATCGSKTATCTVTVKQPLSSIKLSSASLTMNVGISQTLTVTYNPSNTTDSKTVTWKSSNTSVATVSNGRVTAVAPGTAIITATCESKTATCTVIVEKEVKNITMSNKKLSIDVGGKSTLKVYDDKGEIINPDAIVWKSGNNSIATVNSSGVVTAVSNGTVIIYASLSDGTFTTSCEVTVEEVETEVITTTISEPETTTMKQQLETTTKSTEQESEKEETTDETATADDNEEFTNNETESNTTSDNKQDNETLEEQSEQEELNENVKQTDNNKYMIVLIGIIAGLIVIIGVLLLIMLKKK